MTECAAARAPGAVTPGAWHHLPGLALGSCGESRPGPSVHRCAIETPGDDTTRGVDGWTPHVGGLPAGAACELADTGMRLLQRRVDALYVAFRGRVSEVVVRELRRRLATSRALRGPVVVELAPGVEPVLSPRSREGLWSLTHEELRCVVDLQGDHGWCVEVRPSAVMLAREGALGAFEAARGLAALLLDAIEGERLRRLDLAADFQGFELDAVDAKAWLLPSWRLAATDYGTFGSHYQGGERTGFTVGRSGIRLDVYDKTRELMNPENAGAKREEEHARWLLRGWDGRAQVVRFEFQLRSESLEELTLDDGETPMRDAPRETLALLDRLWSYLTRERITSKGPRAGWIRLIRPGTASRRERCRLDDRWRSVQEVTFDAGEAAPPLRRRVRGTSQAKRVAMAAVDLDMLWTGPDALVSRMRGDSREELAQARDSYRGWSTAECENYVRRSLVNARMVHVVLAALRSTAGELLLDRGPHDAAAYLIERRRACLAKCSSIVRVLQERSAMQSGECTGSTHGRPTVGRRQRWRCGTGGAGGVEPRRESQATRAASAA